MILTDEQINTLYRCVGEGPIDKAKIVFFANELGTAEGKGSTEVTIKKLIHDWETQPKIKVGEGFVSLRETILPVNSIFLRNISRLLLALRYNDSRFFDKLTVEGTTFINRFIMNKLYRTDTAVVNLKPLPRSTGSHWSYSSIEEKGYIKLFNFITRTPLNTPEKQVRINALKEAFKLAENALILGTGDKHNKKAFFELLYDDITFETIQLNDKNEIYVSKKPKIILSNYFSSYRGIGLEGLKLLYEYIKMI